MANTIKVAAGHYVDLANPTADMIDLESIAAALSKICRFGGHCPRFYSVAEHSALATQLAHEDGISDERLAAVFMHDAAEAYVGDMVKPLKITLPDFALAESRIESAIAEHFGIDFGRYADVIKHYDRAMLKAEKLAMWPDDQTAWAGFSEIDDRRVRFSFLAPDRAERTFLTCANSIGLRR